MSIANVKRFLRYASAGYAQLSREQFVHSAPVARRRPQKKPRAARKAVRPASRIPAILELHKHLGRIREKIRELESGKRTDPKRMEELKERYQRMDALLMEKLKEE